MNERNAHNSRESVADIRPTTEPLQKSQTGIRGLDEITGGGFPSGRPTLLCGGAGCGKTLLSMQFLVHGAINCDEPGVFMAFEETAPDLTANVASLGFDLTDLMARHLFLIDSVRVSRSEIEQSGAYDLEGLFIRLGHAIDSIGAKRVVLDTIESLFSGLPNQAILRAELRRLFRWLKERGVTAVVTGERGTDPLALTRHGLEEYVSDCVIFLDHRVENMISSRRLRIVKYRGSTHGTNEYPFLIDDAGISVLPVTSLGLQHEVSTERVSSGVSGLDEMLGGEGYFRGSSVLVSGGAGTGKSSLAAHLAASACARGERVMYFAFEESASQIVRNMRSIGIDLAKWIDQDLLRFQATRPTFTGLEAHLSTMLRQIAQFAPSIVVIDPLNSFVTVSSERDVKLMLLRLMDSVKLQQITAFYVRLSSNVHEQIDVEISSLIDTWLQVRFIESGGERNRGMFILKSRGMSHSNQIREFLVTDHGIQLRDAYLGARGVLTGSARLAQEAEERAAEVRRNQEVQRTEAELARKRTVMEAQIAVIRAEFAAEEAAAELLIDEAKQSEAVLTQDRRNMAVSRKVAPR